MKHRASKYSFFFFCLILSFIVLFFCSKNSPFYPMNDWVDANAFFTVGKGMMQGRVPYLDFFEQKGPLLYLIYGLGSLFSYDSFIGVFLLEVLSFSVFLFFCAKIIQLFFEKKYAYFLLPCFASVLTITFSFSHGGSAEEFCLPFLAISCYCYLRYLKEQYPKKMSYSLLFINGFLAGIITVIKYTILGFWFAFMFTMIIMFWKQHNYKEIFKSSFVFLCGMFLPISFFGLYFYSCGGLYDFFYQYFIVNILSYPSSHGFLMKLLSGIINLGAHAYQNLIPSIFIGYGIYCFAFTNRFFDKQQRFYLKWIFACSILFIYGGGIAFRYYYYVLTFFALFGCISILQVLIKTHSQIFLRKRYLLFIFGISFVLLFFSPNYSFSKYQKEELVQYIFADIINKTPNATILNYGFLDGGFYFTTKTLPTTKYFMKQNIQHEVFPEILDAQNELIREEQIDYVIVSKSFGKEYVHLDMRNILEHYRLIKIGKQMYEGKIRTYLLFAKK